MLLHVTPKLHQPSERFHDAVLVDIRIPALGLHLREGRDVIARTPYPNKEYLVASRKYGRKSVTGFFIHAPAETREFVITTRWAVNAEFLLSHTVEYSILDADYDAASDNMMLWGNLHPSHGGWPTRWPSVAKDWTPSTHAPQMDTYPKALSKSKRQGDVRDVINDRGLIVGRHERFRLPSLERDRVVMRNNLTDRMPVIDSAFVSPLCQASMHSSPSTPENMGRVN
ncbi:DUF6012 family protein [Pseudomonas baetica]|uniref:DUF6012 family protein n=1 Tax=Pseudomonas baetica TaxID=674054 RepID=UPI0024065328|nr:DUF6012 family protein [Pseudomonas baetica]MDF9778780.1 hypothetical protein [Pseudomonas baetica]